MRAQRHKDEQRGHHGAVLLFALGVAAVLAITLLLVDWAQLGPALQGAATRPQAISYGDAGAITRLLAVPLVAALLAYLAAWQALRALRIGLYLMRLRRHLAAALQDPALALGVSPEGKWHGGEGAPRTVRLPRALGEARRVLLLGDVGAGKTTLLRRFAYDLARRRALLAVVLGRAPLPVLISLPAYADAARVRQSDLRAYLQGQVRQIGTPGLARALPRLLASGRVALLCDGLSDLREADRAPVIAALAALAEQQPGAAHLVIACDSALARRAPQALEPLATCARLHLTDLAAPDVARALRRRTPRAQNVLDDLRAHHLEAIAASPALLATYLLVQRTEAPLPNGRAALLLAAALHLCARGASPDLPVATYSALLGEAASMLIESGEPAIPCQRTQPAGDALWQWLTAGEPLAPLDHVAPRRTELHQTTVEAACRAALAAGVLSRRMDGTGLIFARPWLRETFAAAALRQMDDGRGGLAPELLHERWTVPLALWAATTVEPASLALRLLQIGERAEGAAVRAGLPDEAHARARCLALALAVGSLGLAIRLPRGDDATPLPARDLAHLRTILDRASVASNDDEERALLAAALRAVEDVLGHEVSATLLALARAPSLDRLARAQVALVLGTLGSPAALHALASLLGEREPTLRAAVAQAFTLAGAAALEPLHAACASDEPTIQERALEVLASLGAQAQPMAATSLRARHPTQRRAAVRILSADGEATHTDELAALLDDADAEVRADAATALGRIGTPQAITALERSVATAGPELRVALAQALGATHSQNTVPALLRLLDDTEAKVRAAAAASLGTLADERAVPPLQARRSDADEWVRHEALAALRRLGRA